MLHKVDDQIKKLAAVTGVMLVAVAEAMAQDKAARPPRRIVVSVPDRKLAVLEGDRVLRRFNVAVGAPASPSPSGRFTVVNHVIRPTWYYKGKVVGPGPGNPVGPRWIGLSRAGYGIHGTNAPWSIGKRASHGCIRLRNSDIEQLFDLVEVGDLVELDGERTAETEALFRAPVVTAAAQTASGDN